MLVYPLETFTPILIGGITNALPIVITTVSAHRLVTGDRVAIAGVVGNTNANVDDWPITVLSGTTFELDDRKGNGDIPPGETYQVEVFRLTLRTYDSDTAVEGDIYSLHEFTQGDKCTFVVDCDLDPTTPTQECSVFLFGRPTADCEWIEIEEIDETSTWTSLTNYVSKTSDLLVYPEMKMSVAAFGSSTSVVKAWLIA